MTENQYFDDNRSKFIIKYVQFKQENAIKKADAKASAFSDPYEN